MLWDEKAAAVARNATRRQIEERTWGHYLLDGLPPFARLAAGGDFGMGSENVAAFMSDAGRLHDTPEGLALHAEREMLAETPPHDFHRRTILDPHATHVGIGWALSGGDFRMAEEFSTRSYARLRISRERAADVRVEGEALPGTAIRYVTVARQTAPRRLSREEANAPETYSFPAAQIMILPEETREEAIGLRSVHSLSVSWGGKFLFTHPIEKPGLWTFLLYFQARRTGAPEPGGSFTLLVE